MFIPEDGSEHYVLCFRPIRTSDTAEKKRLYCHSEVRIKDPMNSSRAKVLATGIVDDMKKRLAGLHKSAW